jgi:hypothetical protein
MEHRDRWKEEAVGDGDEHVVERVREPAERDDPELRDAGDRAPEGGPLGGRYFVGVDGFF